jgi:predicted DNA-binding protein (UPF0251 family)
MKNTGIEECYGKDCLTCTDGCCLHRAAGISAIREKQHETAMRFGKKADLVDEAEYIDSIEVSQCDFIDTIECSDPSIQDLIREAQLDVLRKVIFMWLEKPTTFEAMLLKFVKGETQADLARKRGVTRQNISKMIRNENNRRFKMEIEKLQAIIHFSATEQQIYKLVFEESMTTRTAGKIAGISPASAWKIKKKITEKLDQIEKKYTKRA